jgi:monofunctional biosynthetic peptidoglycan transglycosylase
MKFLTNILALIIALFALLFIYDTLLPPVSTLMVARLVTGRTVERHFVTLRHISPALTRASIAAEDGKFCSHHGVDWEALRGAVKTVIDPDEEASHGGSTITMQTAKNLFLWMGHSYLRKPVEIPLALAIDALWGKHRIMQDYLNIAEFGPGIFGAEAAARHYFGHGAATLSAHEAALLAATLPNPSKRNPARPSGYVSQYAAHIEERVAEGVSSGCAR